MKTLSPVGPSAAALPAWPACGEKASKDGRDFNVDGDGTLKSNVHPAYKGKRQNDDVAAPGALRVEVSRFSDDQLLPTRGSLIPNP